MVISSGFLWAWLWNFRFHNCCRILGSWEIIIFPRTLVERGIELSQLINQKVVRCLDGPADCTSDFAGWSLLKLIYSRDGARVSVRYGDGRNVNPPDVTFNKTEVLCTKEWRGKSSKFVEKYAQCHSVHHRNVPVPLCHNSTLHALP